MVNTQLNTYAVTSPNPIRLNQNTPLNQTVAQFGKNSTDIFHPQISKPTANPTVHFGAVNDEHYQLIRNTYANVANRDTEGAVYDPAAVYRENCFTHTFMGTGAKDACQELVNNPATDAVFVVGSLGSVKRAANGMKKQFRFPVDFELDSIKAGNKEIVRIRQKANVPNPTFDAIASVFPQARPEECYKDNFAGTALVSVAMGLAKNIGSFSEAFILSNNQMGSRTERDLRLPNQIIQRVGLRFDVEIRPVSNTEIAVRIRMVRA